MKLRHEVEIAAPPERVYALLTDLEQVADCMPGVAVDGRDGDAYTGTITVKVGPITAQYAGRIAFVENDPDGRRVVLSARATERNGQGSAEARVASAVAGRNGGSVVEIETDLQVRGRVAQFGRGGIEAVAARMLGELGSNVERMLTQGKPLSGANGSAASARTPAGAELDVGSLVLDVVRPYARELALAGAALLLGYLLGAAREARRWGRWTRTGTEG
ncbi:MAG TPA: SRPBCC family protein [Gaiellaceae bacterium]|nr:SRPBCC family protein [Gaiellaceae bacterium]